MKSVLYIIFFLYSLTIFSDALSDDISADLSKRSVYVGENYSRVSVKYSGYVTLLNQKRYFTTVADYFKDSTNLYTLYTFEGSSDSSYEVYRIFNGGRRGSFYMDSAGSFTYVFEPSNSISPFDYSYIIPREANSAKTSEGYEITNLSQSDIVRSITLNRDFTVRKASFKYIYGTVNYRCKSYRNPGKGLYIPDSVEMSLGDTLFFSSRIIGLEVNK